MPVLPPVPAVRHAGFGVDHTPPAESSVTVLALDELIGQIRDHFRIAGAYIEIATPESLEPPVLMDREWPERELLAGASILVTDLSTDPRLPAGRRLPDGGQVRFFAGSALTGADGRILGALYAWDLNERPVSPADAGDLDRFARHASALLEMDQALRDAGWERKRALVTERILQMIATGADLVEVLEHVALEADAGLVDSRTSIHLVSGGRLGQAVGPNLPPGYRNAFNGTAIGPDIGSCGTAAYTGETTVVSDIATDHRWINYRHLPLSFGLRACWSVPLTSSEGEVIGTFAVYYDRPRVPTPEDMADLDRWVHLAEVAIVRARDIAALRAAMTRDPLTGLVNRAELLARLDRADSSHPVAALFVDLDRFKFVNDALGHEVGDRILKAAAGRILACAGPHDLVARLGGDEFVLVLRRPDNEDIGTAATTLAHQLVASIRRPLFLDGRTISLSASVGVAIHDGTHPFDPAGLIGGSDLAMYAAKRAGHSSVAFFTPHLREQASTRMELESELARAMENGDLTVAFQPTVRMSDSKVLGVEALLRWHSPVRGAIPPTTFISVAEETGQITALGAFVLRRACSALAGWLRSCPSMAGAAIWVNVSARQLLYPGFDTLVSEILCESGLSAQQLGIEVTESIFIGTAPMARDYLNTLRTMGVRVAIDDFGIGYSSLAQLEHLPVDVLKLDREFVAALDAEDPAVGIIEAILTLSRTMHLGVVAEGVETERQRRVLLELGCHIGQGFLWSPAVAEADLPAVVERIERGGSAR